MTEYSLTTPIKEDDVRKLKAGDDLLITGIIITARDKAHQRILEYTEQGKEIPVNLDGAVIYHCGPIMMKKDDHWTAISAGPTTSTRMNAPTPKLLEKFKVKIIIGKGGMSPEVVETLKNKGAVYCHFTGGAGVLAAKNIKKVESVEWLDLGMAEALWLLKVENFGPVTVTIDSHGNSIYGEIKKQVESNLTKIYQQIG